MNLAETLSGGLSKPFVGRGGAQLDFNRDGKMDLVVVSHGSLARWGRGDPVSCQTQPRARVCSRVSSG